MGFASFALATLVLAMGEQANALDAWHALSSVGAPSARVFINSDTAIWTGSEMIIWGGSTGAGQATILGDGARYNPLTDTWTAITATAAPSARAGFTTVWTGTEMIVWGGNGPGEIFLNTGARYNPANNTWTPVTETDAPNARASHSAIWTGNEMIVWGGHNGGLGIGTPKNDGACYNPVTDTWTSITLTGAPSVRAEHPALWTGSEMIVWGGYQWGMGPPEGPLGDGARFNPTSNTWTPIQSTGAPSARYAHLSTVWTGSEMIIHGGHPRSTSGARYNPTSDTWTPTSTSGAPAARSYDSAIWTGSEMIIWGGTTGGTVAANDGARYNPASDSWIPMTLSGAPGPRNVHAAVWTGSQMIIWGGSSNTYLGGATGYLNDTYSYTVAGSALPLPPVIASFNPMSGPTGTVVTITGTNFGPAPASNIVHFGAVRATVTAASPTNLIVLVPVGATYAPITVTVGGLTAYSDKPFVITFPSCAMLSTSSFAARQDFTVGVQPYTFGFGDIDGDGQVDLAMALHNSSTIAFFRNVSSTGVIAFTPAGSVNVGGSGNTILYPIFADLDGDGKLDLIAANWGTAKIVVFRNASSTGTFSFETRTDLAVGPNPYCVAVGDFDHDGRLDIVSANSGNATVSVIRNVSAPGALTAASFGSRQDFSTGAWDRYVAVGDIDGDGFLDLITANGADNTVSVIRNNASTNGISFAARVDFSTAESPGWIAVGDLDGDGKAEIVVGGDGSTPANTGVFVHRNQASPGSINSGSLAAKSGLLTNVAVRFVELADMNGDGKLDVLATVRGIGKISVMQNQASLGALGASSFAAPVQFDLNAAYPYEVRAADLDGDGRPDLLATWDQNTGYATVYRNLGNFTPVIMTQPTNQMVGQGSNATFTVAATGSAPLSYQWRSNGVAITGATNFTLMLANAQGAWESSAYSVVVNNSCGAVTSAVSVLTVLLPPTITGVAQSPFTFSTLAGMAGNSGSNDGTGTGARFNVPTGLAVDGAGNVYVADAYNSIIRKITSFGVVSTIAGLAETTGSADGSGANARFTRPGGVALDGSGNIYVADSANSTIRKISTNGVVSTIAGVAGNVGTQDGVGTNARFYFPFQIGFDSLGNMFVSDPYNLNLRKITPNAVVSTVAGIQCGYGVTVDRFDNVYATRGGNGLGHAIWKVSASGTIITFAGMVGTAGSADGIGTSAQFSTPIGLASDAYGNVFVADKDNFTIRKITPGGTVTTVAGLAGNRGSTDGLGNSARFDQPFGVTLDADGNLYVADTYNHTIRVGRFAGAMVAMQPSVSGPQSQLLAVGINVTFTATVTGTPPFAYQWRFNDSPITSATNASFALTNVQTTNAGNYVIVVTNPYGSATSAVVTLSLQIPPSLTAQPRSQTLYAGNNLILGVRVTGTSLNYQWRFNGLPIAGQTNALLFLPGTTTNNAGNYTVVVTNSVGSVTSVGASVMVNPLPANRSVIAWGAGGQGKSGPSDFGQSIVPTGLTNVVLLAAGTYHSLAIKSDRTVAAWGNNLSGQSTVPGGLSEVAAVAGGYQHSMALKSDGMVIPWGAGFTTGGGGNGLNFGQSLVPAGLNGVVSVSAGIYHSIALKNNGTVAAWGAGTTTTGNLGIEHGQSLVPAGLSGVVEVSAGYYHNLALKSDGTVVAWGAGTTTTGNFDVEYGESIVPAGLNGVVAVAAGGYHSLVLKNDGTVVAWGSNSGGQTNVPSGLNGVVAVAATGFDSLALKSDGTVVVWGSNSDGQANVPTGLSGVLAVSAGHTHVLALMSGPPAILVQPQSLVVTNGANPSFSVEAIGPGPLDYQWRFNGVNLLGATNASLTLSNAQATDAGHYSVRVGNPLGYTHSDDAVLVVLSPPPVPVKVVVQGNGTVLRSPDQTNYTVGQIVTLTAVPDDCYRAFAGWSDGDTNNPRSITVGLSNCFTAIFTNAASSMGAVISVSMPTNSSYGDSAPYNDQVWRVEAPPYPLNITNGIGTLVNPVYVAANYPPDFGMHDNVYVANYVPDPTRSVVTFEFSMPMVVDQLEIIQHVFGATRIEGFVGNSLDAMVSIGSVFGPAGDVVDVFVVAQDGDAQVFRFANSLPGRFFQFIIRKTTNPGAFALHRAFPRDAAGVRIGTAIGPIAVLAVNCPSNTTVECAGTNGTRVFFIATATDSCGSNVAVVCVPPSGSVIPLGTNAVLCSATDPFGATNTCTFSVAVVDTTPPLITSCPTNRAVILGGGECVATIPNLTSELSAADVCGPVTVTQSPAAGAPATLGTNVVTLTVRDAFGNASSCTVTVVIAPLLVPVKVIVQGNGVVTKTPDQPLYTNCQTVTLTAVEGNCLWRFSRWLDGDTNNPHTITVGLSNCFTAVFTNVAPLSGTASSVWDKAFGGTGLDAASALLATSDGGYVVAGWSTSGVNGNKSSPVFGIADGWVVKLDANGNKLWDYNFGGMGEDAFAAICKTQDGGYALAGYTKSGVGGNKSSAGYGDFDFFVVRIDASGQKVWDRTFGGTGGDACNSIQATADGGFILGGNTLSGVSGNKTTPGYGGNDFWAIKLDANGNKQWEQTFGGSGDEDIHGVAVAPDGGFLLAGLSSSGPSGTKTGPNYGSHDGWLVKIDSAGTKQWEQTFGGSASDSFTPVLPAADGGFLIGGTSWSGVGGNKTTPNYGQTDFWLLKIDANGSNQWQRSYGGSGGDNVSSLLATDDGGYLCGGHSRSGISGNKTSSAHGGSDFWVLKLDAAGDKQWEQTFGGIGEEQLFGIARGADSGYVLAGSSESGVSGTKTSASWGGLDLWVMKLGAEEVPIGVPSVCVANQYNFSGSITITNCQPITLRTSFTNGTIRYTLDGSSPGPGSPLYVGQFTLPPGTLTLRAVAYSADHSQSVTNCGVTLTIVPGSATATVKTIVQGNGVVTRTPEQALYTNCQTVTLVAMPTNCYWAFSHWTDGVMTNPANEIVITVGLTNCYTAVFTNLVPNCDGGSLIVTVNGRTNDGFYVTNRADVCIYSAIPGAILRYTTNCTEPDLNSTNYSSCFTLLYKGEFPDLYTVVVRAAAFDANGRLIGQQACPVTIVLTNICEGKFRLFATVKGGGGGLLGGGTVGFSPVDDPYPCGTVVDLQALPAPGWSFMGWLGDAEGTNIITPVVMAEPRCVDAVFGTRLTANVTGSGVIRRIPEADYYPYNSTVRLVAEPAAGQYFVGWSGNASGTNAILNPPFNVISANPSVTATFAALPVDRHALSMRLNGRGTVNTRPFRSYYATSVLVTNTAVADSGQMFLGWSGDTNGMVLLTAASMSVPMSASRVITANFTRGPRLDIARCQGALSKEGFELMVTGDPGVPYEIQATTMLLAPPSQIQWTALGTVSNTIGMATFLDRTSTNHSQRFYRAVAP